MELVQDLSAMGIGNRMRHTGLFICPVCKKQMKLSMNRGLAQNTCKQCQGTQKLTHGMTDTPVYYVWQAMRARCSNPKNPKYHIYGGKGITVCDEWQTFEGFWKDMEDGYVKGLTIDRKESNKGYNKENCQWLSHSKNSAKTDKVRPITQYHVVQKPSYDLIEIKQWPSALSAAEELGLTAAHITVVCQGKRKTHGGYAWKYTEELSSI